MRPRAIVLLIALLCCIAPTFAEAPATASATRHPIDVTVDRLLEEDQSTHGQIRAFGKGCELWDQELNRAYAETMQLLGKTEPARKALKEAQRAWLAFRDKEYAALAAIYETKDGTMYRPMQVADRMEIVKARAQQLAGTASLLKD